MKYYLFEEPNFKETNWCKLYKRAIKTESNNVKIKIIENPKTIDDEEGIAIIIGTNLNWLNNKTKLLENFNLKIIAVGPTLNSSFSHNSIMSDYDLSIEMAISYCHNNNKNNILLFGPNKNSLGDNIIVNKINQIDPQIDILWEEKAIEKNILFIKENLKSFNAFLCCNMVTATALLTQLKNDIIENKIWIISLIDSKLGEYVSPTITSFKQNEIDIGKKTIHLALFLKRNWDISRVNWYTKTEIIIRESTNNTPFNFDNEKVNIITKPYNPIFYNDETIEEILNLEKLLNNIENCDKLILKNVLENKTYQQISEIGNMSENTVKYRIKRMEKLCNVSSREELLFIIKKYIAKEKYL